MGSCLSRGCPSRARRGNRLAALVATAALAAAAVGWGQEGGTATDAAGGQSGFAAGELRVADLAPLQRVVVVEGGRPMPLDSFARITLLRLSGRSSFARRPAIEWFARVLFTPNETHDDGVFLVDNPEVIDAMGLVSRGRDRYGLAFLLDGLPELERLAEDAGAISEDNRTVVEREILRLWNNVGAYANLLSTFAFTYPHADFQVADAAAAALLELPGPGTYSYLDIALREDRLRSAVTEAGRAHAASGAFSRTDGLLLRLGQSLATWRANFDGLPLPIIPVTVPGGGGTQWLTPWQALGGEFVGGLGRDQRSAIDRELLALRDLQVAYLEGRPVHFALAARQFSDSVQQRTAATLELQDPRLEVLYNGINPYNIAKLTYGAGLLTLALSFLGFRTWLYRLSLVLLVAGFVPHTLGLVLRMLITARPPVTNLYETFTFVGWGSVVCGMVMERLRKRPLGLFCGLAGGFVFFLLSAKFSAEGDTMPVLQAVLDTNFWLSTHVLVITTGYMTCCVAGLIGHVYLLQAVLPGSGAGTRRAERLARTYRTLFGTLAVGLIFSFVGTMLGGIWADQSWGRFWGWDPKENGALMIVLWCALLFHARMGKMIGPFGMAAGAALLIIVVMMAWFGINLLGVGLHSYGFTEGVFWGLMAYIAAEIAFVAAIAAWHRKQRRRGSSDAPPPPPAMAADPPPAPGSNGVPAAIAQSRSRAAR